MPCLKVIGGDSTAVNTGRKGGAITLLEKELDRRLVWLICLLHVNELPLRHLFVDLDGPTQGDKAFKGPIGKILKHAEEYTVNRDFTPIADGEGLRDLPQDVIKDLSRDQRYLYEIVKSIRSGTLSDIAKKHKIGPVNHSRWLTLASRICRLYVSNVELDQNSMNNLRTLAHFVVTHYAPMWFNIKCEPLYKDGPLNVLRAVKLFKLLPPDVQSIV